MGQVGCLVGCLVQPGPRAWCTENWDGGQGPGGSPPGGLAIVTGTVAQSDAAWRCLSLASLKICHACVCRCQPCSGCDVNAFAQCSHPLLSPTQSLQARKLRQEEAQSWPEPREPGLRAQSPGRRPPARPLLDWMRGVSARLVFSSGSWLFFPPVLLPNCTEVWR